MARTGITKTQVRAIRDSLLAEGRYPSADAVRGALGDTGSKSTIHRYLKELAAEEDTGPGATSDAGMQALIEQLAHKVHSETERRLQALRAAHEEALRAKEAELLELRNTVAALSARLREQEGGAAALAPAVVRDATAREPARVLAGFGGFGELLSNSRSGRNDTSLFSLVGAGGRDNVIRLDRAA